MKENNRRYIKWPTFNKVSLLSFHLQYSGVMTVMYLLLGSVWLALWLKTSLYTEKIHILIQAVARIYCNYMHTIYLHVHSNSVSPFSLYLQYSGVMTVMYLLLGSVWLALWLKTSLHTEKMHILIGAVAVAGKAYIYLFLPSHPLPSFCIHICKNNLNILFSLASI